MPKVAIISDIHSNLEALEAVLADIDSQSVDEVFCLGDIVGYGPDPIACIDLVMERCTRVVCGNHDEALFKGAYGFHRVARDAIDWTRKILKPSWLRPASKRRWTYLAQLPLVKHWNDNLLVHGSPRQPTEEYVTPNHAAWPPPGMFEEIFAAFSSVCCVGHTHFAGVFAEGPRFTPQADFSGGFKAEGTKLLVNVGSVGQPRDHNPKSCYITVEDDVLRYHRVEYPVEVTQAKIRAIDMLDDRLADRLAVGE